MHRHLIEVNKVCAPLKRNNNQEINIDVLLNFSAINFPILET